MLSLQFLFVCSCLFRCDGDGGGFWLTWSTDLLYQASLDVARWTDLDKACQLGTERCIAQRDPLDLDKRHVNCPRTLHRLTWSVRQGMEHGTNADRFVRSGFDRFGPLD